MVNQQGTFSASRFSMRAFSLVLLIALLLVRAAPPPDVRAQLQPALLELARSTPQAPVGVVVQKLAEAAGVEAAVARLGGTITMELPIVNGFAATLPARAALALSKVPGVRWVSLDAPVLDTAALCLPCVNTTNLQNAYIRAIGADRLWNQAPAYLQGQGIGVAVVDSGVNPNQDLYTPLGRNRLVASVAFNGGYNQTVFDGYGHGTHIAGIIGGNGSMSSNGQQSGGTYIGVAPQVNLINVKVSDDEGASNTSHVIAGLQWVYNNKDRYNIRVVNLSLNSSIPESYHTNAIDAAVEVLWFNKIVVVVSAGNLAGPGKLYPPANDPFVITVGATDDRGTPSVADDVMARFSAHGKTEDGFSKPDLVAPGTNIASLMANTNSVLAEAHPSNMINRNYFRMSGTSMSAPIVAGAVALLLQANPHLTPDQVKYRLMATARRFDQPARAGAGYLDIYAAVHSTTTASANTGLPVSRLLVQGGAPRTWSNVTWGSVTWGSVTWGSVTWGSVTWGSDYWGK